MNAPAIGGAVPISAGVRVSRPVLTPGADRALDPGTEPRVHLDKLAAGVAALDLVAGLEGAGASVSLPRRAPAQPVAGRHGCARTVEKRKNGAESYHGRG